MDENGKLASDLSLALYIPEQYRESDDDLFTGYDERTNTWELIVRYSGDIDEDINRLGGRITKLSGGYGIVTIPQNQIENLSDLYQIEYIEKPHRLFWSDRQAVVRSCIDYLYEEPYRLSGRGCLVAVIDSGIDWMHPDFIDDDGSRILFLFDQTTGTEYDRATINEALSGNEIAKDRLSRTRDLSGHGTFVAGIAAGNGRASGGLIRGVAYESELIIVKLGESIQGQFPRTTRLMEAVDYVLDKAITLKKPVAINMSFGNNQGSHDGTDLLSSFLNSEAARYKNVMVCGTGNEAGNAGHASGLLSELMPREVEFVIGDYESSINIQLWKNYADDFDITLISPGGETFTIMDKRNNPENSSTNSTYYRFSKTRVYVHYGEPSPYSIYQQIYFEFVPESDYVNPGVWKYVFTPGRIVDGRYDLWLPVAGSINSDTVFLLPDDEVTLTVPSATDKVISVGAYNSRTDTYADFSGRGFTRLDTEIKPDIVAPGVDIQSTKAGGGYVRKSGTSMAAPFVTGAAALLMEWGIDRGNDPYLYGEKVKAYLIKAARALPGESRPSRKTGWGALCLRRVFD